jgi:16S rRNA processing protein RimM
VADQPTSKDSSTIPIGYVRKPHGIRGDVLVRGLVSDADERLIDGVTLTTAGDPPRTFTVLASTPHAGDVIMTLAGVENRNEAEQLVGTQFVMLATERRTLLEGEWWAEDLVGCLVVDLAGEEIGTVTNVITGAAQDRLAVRRQGGDIGEVPFVDPLVPEVDVDRRRIVVDLPEGLFG